MTKTERKSRKLPREAHDKLPAVTFLDHEGKMLYRRDFGEPGDLRSMVHIRLERGRKQSFDLFA